MEPRDDRPSQPEHGWERPTEPGQPAEPYQPNPGAPPDPGGPSYQQPYPGQPYQQPYPGEPYQQPYPAEQPYSSQPPYQPYGPPAQPPVGGPRQTNGLAIAALVTALLGLVTGIAAPVGAVLGHLASRRIAQSGEEGASMAKAAIWIGWIVTGVYVVACCALVSLFVAVSSNQQPR